MSGPRSGEHPVESPPATEADPTRDPEPPPPAAPEETSGCIRSGCTVVDHGAELRCSLATPVGVKVPPGKHQHIACPVHGDHVIRG